MTAQLRTVGPADIDLLVALRMAYLYDGRPAPDEAEAQALRESLASYFRRAMEREEFVGVVAEAQGKAVSAAFLSIAERPPRSAGVSCRVGTVYSVYTYPEYRRQGLATAVMKALLHEAEKLELGSIDLSASPDGRALYEKLGFAPIRYTAMRLQKG